MVWANIKDVFYSSDMNSFKHVVELGITGQGMQAPA
jgi:hypothetical protein